MLAKADVPRKEPIVMTKLEFKDHAHDKIRDAFKVSPDDLRLAHPDLGHQPFGNFQGA